jgi:hypothetical protein
MRAIISNDFIKYSPCDNSNLANFYGEFEDYCVSLGSDFTPCGKTANLKSTVNIGKINLNWDKEASALGYDIYYRVLGKNDWIKDASLSNTYEFKTEDCFKYEIQTRTICENDLSEFTPILNVVASCSTAARENPLFEQITIAPNPFDSYFNVDFAIAEPQTISIVLLNNIGQTIREVTGNQYDTGSHHIVLENLNNFPKGIYYLKLMTKKGSVVKKIILL